jgi:hypothetical protein
VACEGDDAIPTNTREVRQLGITQPDIWPVSNPVCVRVDYRVLLVFLEQCGFQVKRIHAILCDTSRRFSDTQLRAIPLDDSLSLEAKSRSVSRLGLITTRTRTYPFFADRASTI